MRSCFLVILFLCLAGCALAQQPAQDPGPVSQAPPRSDQDKSRETEAGESSSKDTRIDLSPPRNDARNRTGAAAANSDLDTTPEDDTAPAVGEMHPFNPYRAVKDLEVGDFYFKKKNYKAALARYQDALIYKENDAVANFRAAQCLEKLDQPDDAVPFYQEYLRILPEGPLSKDAKKSLARLGAPEKKETSQKSDPQP
jgi:tetratricopeptide (TPR) repeat protein